MSYGELANLINSMTREQQNEEAIICLWPEGGGVNNDTEFYNVIDVKTFPDGVRPNHPYIILDD